MSATYCMCEGMRQPRTARGGKNGCRAAVQSWNGSVCISNWYDSDDQLKVRIGTNDGSSCCSDWNAPEFTGTFEEFKEALQLLRDIKTGKVSVTRHRDPDGTKKLAKQMKALGLK